MSLTHTGEGEREYRGEVHITACKKDIVDLE